MRRRAIRLSLIHILDNKLVEEGTARAHTAALEQKVAVLQQELAAQAAQRADEDGDTPWREDTEIELHVPQERASRIRADVVDGQKCLLIPLEEGEHARINGVEQPL